MRQLIVGDVHGCSAEFAELIQQFSPKPGDQIFQVGDLINKGPDSAGCLDLVEQHHIRCVRGNHEAKFLRIMDTPETLRSAKEVSFLKKLGPDVLRRVEAIRKWPLWIDEVGFTLVHAGLQPGKSQLVDMSDKVVLTIRTWDGVGEHLDRAEDRPWFEQIHWPKPVLFGHWALLGLMMQPQFKCLDSGCVYGRQLSGYCPQEDHLYQVQAKKEYVSMTPGVILT